VSAAAWRCASCCCSSRPAAARRADQPPRRRVVQWLEQHLEKYPGAVVAVTHDRYFLDNVAQWILELDRGRAYPYEGNYSTYLEKKASPPRGQGKKDAKLPSGSPTNSTGCAPTPRPARPRTRPACSATRRWPPRPSDPQARLRGDPDPAGSAPGQRRGRGRAPLDKGFGDRVLIDDCPSPAAQRHRRCHRPERRRQDHAVQDDRRARGEADAGTIEVGETVKISYVDQSRGRYRPQQEPVGGRLRRPRLHQRRQGRDPLARLRQSAFGFKGPDQQKKAGCSPAASATGSTSR
jgi:hypothetical protein